ncbi:MAG TPA: ABC transporter permease [Gaiellaceae bacterium]
MARFVIARLLASIFLYFAITLFVFVVFFVMPQPTIRAPGRGGNASDYDIHNSLRLHGTLPHQYVQFSWGIVRHGSLGASYQNRRNVTDQIVAAAPVTISLVFGGLVFWLLLALPIGILSALRPRSLLDRSGMVFVLIGVSAHPAWLGLVLGWLLGFRLHIFPFTGYCEIFSPTTICGGPTQWAYHLLLPWFTFAFLFAAIYARMIRASVLETLDEEYVRTARAKGAGEAKVLKSHVLRNAMLPIVTMVGMDIGTALGGVIFIESVFGLPGLGGMLRQAITAKDLPVILGVVTFTTICILVLNLIIDVTYAFIDPRVRFAQGGLIRRRSPAASRSGPVGEPAATTS